MIYLSTNIKLLRKNSKKTQRALAKSTGIKHHNIGAYEEGRATPSPEGLVILAKHFNVTIEALIATDMTKINS